MSELIVVSDADLDFELTQKATSDTIGETLARTYPGYRWRVEVHHGIADVRCEHAAGRAGYTFNLVRHGIPDTRAIVLAGGEILERFSLSRRGFAEDQYRSLPRFAGQLLPEW